MNLVKQKLSEIYQAPAVLPGEDNLAEIAICWKILPFLRLVWYIGGAFRGRFLQRDCYPWSTRFLPTWWCFLLKMPYFLSFSYFSFKLLVTVLNPLPIFFLMPRRGAQLYPPHRGVLAETQAGGLEGSAVAQPPCSAGPPWGTLRRIAASGSARAPARESPQLLFPQSDSGTSLWVFSGQNQVSRSASQHASGETQNFVPSLDWLELT